jgi:hypothetical protein
MDLRQVNLKALNSITKYPSIPTYHALDPSNGRLIEGATAFDGFVGPVLATEKVDGTNSRVIVLPGGQRGGGMYLLGSREELLHAKGDLIWNPSMGIVDALRPTADRLLAPVGAWSGEVIVFYFESFGGTIGAAAKQYTGSKAVSIRLFDVAMFDDVTSMLEWAPERISHWRENGGQRFLGEGELNEQAARFSLELTPRLFELSSASELPRGLEDVDAALGAHLPKTSCAIDDGAGGQAEGIVVRALDRSRIAKMRCEDYHRTLRKKK